MEWLTQHAAFRAGATTIRDLQAAHGKMTEENWWNIEGFLRRSWRSLHSGAQ
ncbi:MAG: hypothetical protein HYX27_10520 [Acidobacteria bacterium]|nr:hypothetical protein [Acidobacteriota bacterium]